MSELSSILKKYQENQRIFVIGGSEIYRELLPYCNLLHITHIFCNSRGNVEFPIDISEISNSSEYRRISYTDVLESVSGLMYQQCCYKKSCRHLE
jgi:dihydrofolate reductase